MVTHTATVRISPSSALPLYGDVAVVAPDPLPMQQDLTIAPKSREEPPISSSPPTAPSCTAGADLHRARHFPGIDRLQDHPARPVYAPKSLVVARPPYMVRMQRGWSGIIRPSGGAVEVVITRVDKSPPEKSGKISLRGQPSANPATESRRKLKGGHARYPTVTAIIFRFGTLRSAGPRLGGLHYWSGWR